MVKTTYNRVRLSEPLMHLVLLLLMATCLTGCGLQFPFYCEDKNASICYLQRRPIFSPREKPTSNTTSDRQPTPL
jgi:predicted small lipoprotein YifL